MTVFYWMIAAAAFLVIEILTMGLTTVWFAGGSLLAAVFAIVGAPIWLQFVAFIVVSLVLLVLTRPWAMHFLNNRTVKTNAESLVGEVCIVTKKIDNLRAEGQVKVKGQEWTARSVDPDQIIEQDTKVKIQTISGVKLMVVPVEE